MKRNKRQLLNRIALGLVLSTTVCGTVFAAPAATTLPTGNVDVKGVNPVTVDPANTAANPVMRITQDTGVTNAQIDWQTFSIGSAATVNIVQNSSNQTLVNRVITNNMSEIYGKMNASGNVVLVNPNGILLAKGSEINAGGFAAYASAGTTLTSPENRTSEGNIIANGTINAGVGIAKTLAQQFNVTNYAVGLGDASAFGNANKIALVANGDVKVNGDAKLTAVDTTTMSGSSKQGAEGFNMGGVASSANGAIYVRPDANDNDYGQVYLNGTQIFRSPTINVYYNANVVGTATTDDGVLYNKKNFAKDGGMKWDNLIDTSEVVTKIGTDEVKKTDAEVNTDAGTVAYLTPKDPYSVKGSTVVGYALVHNMAQLQDIDTTINGKTNADGKLDGTYALGKDLYAQTDKVGNDYAYVLKHNGTNENPIIFTTVDGTKLTAVSGKDSGIFTSATEKKLPNGAVITYKPGATNSVSTTYNGTTYSYTSGNVKDASGATYTVNETNDGYVVTKNLSGVTTQITDTKTIATIVGLPIALNEFADQADLNAYLTNYTGDVSKDFAHMNTSTWNKDASGTATGFNPIGDTANPFTGTIFGIGGDVIHIGDGLSEIHTIYDLPINLPTTDNVGLVGVGSGATIDYVQEKNTSITGHSNVGGLMGKATNNSTISDSANMGKGINGVLDITQDTGYVRTTSTDQVSNIGGLIGDMENSSIVESANSATIIGQVGDITDLNVKNVGGLAGSANYSTITRSVNQGNVFGEEKTAGIAGSATSTQIGEGVGALDDPTSTVYNNAQITGTTDTGGIVGYGNDIHMYGVYNTNEDAALSGNSQYVINPDGTIRGVNPAFTMRKGNKYDADGHLLDLSASKADGQGIYSDAALSVYGKITGTTNTGGLVGNMESTSTIDTAYNAGNVTGTTDTGGLVGRLNTSISEKYATNIKNAYNGDNNTVIREDLGTIPDKVKAIVNQTFDPVQSGNSTPNSYSFNPGDANYYSFYTQDPTTKAKTYYYFIPTGGKTEAGAGGAFVTYDANTNSITFVKTADLPNSSTRIYTNRVGYKDANINGTTNTGGLFGEMKSGVVTTTYDTGTVNKGVVGTSTGALVGDMSGGTLSASFYANNVDKTTDITKQYAGQTNTIGSSSTGTVDATVKGNTLEYWRNSDHIKDLTNGGEFVGLAAAVDGNTGYQKFTGQDGITYYWTPQGEVYYYVGTTKKTVFQYEKATGKYKDIINNVYYTIDPTETKAVEQNVDSTTGSSEWVYEKVIFHAENSTDTITMNYVTHASNETENNTWIEYPDETTPLLQHFMFANNITRDFTYDAKTHNYKTDDVNNIYGRADFTDGVSGKNVNTSTQAQSADPKHTGESQYFYNSAAIWSPQHGYKINANVSVTIHTTPLDVIIEGTRTYGDAGNTTGYYVVVPYQLPLYDANGFEKRDAEGNILLGDPQWAYYKVVQDGVSTSATPYTLMDANDWKYGGKDYRTGKDAEGNVIPKEGDLKALCDAKATYMATYKGVAGLEATKLNEAVQTVIQALRVDKEDPTKDNAIVYTSGGTALTQIITKNDTSVPAKYPRGDQSLEAGTYNVVGIAYDDKGMITNMNTANIGGIDNDHNNYKITYAGGLTVNKADLFYTYDGTKVYGDANGSGTNVYKLVGTDANSENTSVTGYLKSFDSGKLTVDTNNVITAGTGVTTNGLVGTGPMTMSGTVPEATYNIAQNGEQAITQAKDSDSYYQVLVNPADGTLKTYKVTKFANGTMSIAAANNANATYINNNYNMVWRSNDSTASTDAARTTTSSTGAVGGATILKSGDGTGYAGAGTAITAAASSELITPAELQVTVTGTRKYGDLMVKDVYNTGATNVFNITGAGTTATGSGLKAGDTINGIVDATKMNPIIDGIEALTGNHPDDQINEATHVGTYNLIGNTVQTASNIDVATQNTTTKHFDILNTNNYNYIIKNGAHAETITPETVTVTTTGERVYGDANTTTTNLTFTAPTLETWDQAKWTTTISDELKNNVQNRTVIADHAGVYGTNGSANNKYAADGALYYSDAQKTDAANALGNDYVIDYQDAYTIKKAPLTVTVTGERYYGDNMNAAGAYTTSSGTIPAPDTLTKQLYNVDVVGIKNVNGDTAANILNTANMKTKLGTVDNGVGDATTVGSKTHIGEYTGSTTVKFTLDNVNADPKETSTNTILSSGDYYVNANGANSLTIVKRPLTLTTTGGKVYDTTSTDPTAASAYDINTTATGDNWNKGLATGDETLINKTAWIGLINHKNTATEVGTYGTNGTNDKTGYLTYNDTNKGTIEAALPDYDVHYADKYTITGAPVTIYYEGNRTYGANGTVTNTAFTETGIMESEKAALWTAHEQTWKGQYDDVTAADTHHGVYGTEGTSGNAYVTGAMTLAAGEKTDLEAILSNYIVTYKDKLTINPKDVTLHTTGTRTYGDANSTINYGLIVDKNAALANQRDKDLLANYQTTLKNAIQVDSSITERSHAGTYGTDGTLSGNNAVLTYTDDQKNATSAQLNGDYNIHYTDKLTIDKRNATITQNATKDYGTGAEHTAYDAMILDNVKDFDADAFTSGKTITNTSDRATNVGTYTNSLMTVTYGGVPAAENYNITTNAVLKVVPADFTYTADHTSYWQYQHIPAQTGKVTNSYGEDVSDLVGTLTWPTPADGKVVGIFPIWGRGSNDGTGNYNPIQALGNPTALEVKKVPKNDQTDSALNENLEGAWQSFRRPLLDIMYLKIKDTGFKSWDNGVFVTANPYVPAAGKDNYGMITFNGEVLK